MIVGVDLDGTISRMGFYNPSIKLPWWLFIFLVPLVLVIKPNRRTVEKLRMMKVDGHKIIIVSARPPWATAITAKWLKFHQIPFDKIFCVGFGKSMKQRKLDIIKKEGIQIFVDDDRGLLNLLNRDSIRAINRFN